MSVTGDAITVQCACGKKLKAPASSAGRKAKCPGCGSVLTVGAPATAASAPPRAAATSPAPARAASAPPKAPVARAAPPPPPPPAEPDPLDDIYGLAEDEKKAAASASQSDSSPRCPSCGAAMTAGALLCVNCGFDLRTGRKAEAPPVAGGRPALQLPGSAKSKPVDMMAPQGSFLPGLCYSTAFGLGGGLLWFGVAWATDWDIYFLVILVGVLAGVGMQIGQKGYSAGLGGVMAALITLVITIAARVAVILVIVLPMLNAEEFEGEDGFDERVVEQLTDENLKAAGVKNAELASETQYDVAHNAAIAKLKGMDKSEYNQLVANVDEENEKTELTQYLAAEINEQKPKAKNNRDRVAAMSVSEAEARQRVDRMSADERKAELKRHNEAAAAEYAAAEAGGASEDSGPGAGAAAIGIAVILFLVFGIKPLIFLIIAMAVAYRTASGSVSG